jgi:hypothetical protein
VRNDAWDRRRVAARRYRPNRIRLLLVGERPPEDAGRYFYFEEAGSRDPLFDGLCEVLFEGEPGDDKVPYLRELRRRGVFVVELKPDTPLGAAKTGDYVGPFVLNLAELAPEHIILLGATVHEALYKALAREDSPVVNLRVTAPDPGRQVTFRQELRHALVRAGLEQLMRPLPAARTQPETKPPATPKGRGRKSRS